MSLFVCDKCKVIENTAAGHYWTRGLNGSDKRALCSECMPVNFMKKGGKWHNLFKKQIATKELIKKMGEEQFVYVSDIPGVKAKAWG